MDAFLGNEILAAQIAHIETVEPREARFEEPRSPMHPLLLKRLDKVIGNSTQLYSHQARAYDAAMAGKDVIVVTGTNSGKTLCYNLPALQWSLTEPAVRTFYLFPTKALAQDQLGKLEQIAPGPQTRIATYDGDTPAAQRGSIRRLADIILTNPDMLHVGILPGHENWTKFLKSLRLIVIDEMHVYRGVFGSHVGNILRRLLRLCEWHRSRPQIIACSATIGNPEELFEQLTGRKGHLIDEDGSPKARRTFVFWNPPEVGENTRMSANVVTSELLATLSEAGLRSLAFNRARVSAELVLRYTRRRVQRQGEVGPEKIESYRAGYTAKERRQIEQALFKGDLLGLSATNAMELGVDVGGLDAVLMNGYPGTISSFFQQAGRAGRGTRPGLSVMVAHDDPLEQFLIRKPEMVLQGANESVAVNPGNPQILSRQLLCAAYERPISPSELERFGQGAIDVAESLDRSGELAFRAGMFFYPSHEPPAPNVSIRGLGGDQVSLILDGEVIGSMERWRAMQHAHKGAMYLHRGQSYLVTSLDLDSGRAELQRLETDYYTTPIVQSVIEQNVQIKGPEEPNSKSQDPRSSLVGVSVTNSVIGFRRKTLDGDHVLSVEPLELPTTTFDTIAVRFDLSFNIPPLEEAAEMIEEETGGIHGLEHALLAVAPLIAGCDRGDLGSAWYTAFPRFRDLNASIVQSSSPSFSPAVFVYDQTPGGVGLCEKLYANLGRWVIAAYQLVSTCECAEGCPACLMSARCEANNDHLSKPGALKLLEGLSP
ncbi:MAG TPA: DEAD/DEAH box helicase [Fimbriimonadaceae bacterium]|nr:DEAD/DEAH box helicase [Fimbriimonadaceae bacterium]